MPDAFDLLSKTREETERGRRWRDRAGWRDKCAALFAAHWSGTRPSVSVPFGAESLPLISLLSVLKIVASCRISYMTRILQATSVPFATERHPSDLILNTKKPLGNSQWLYRVLKKSIILN